MKKQGYQPAPEKTFHEEPVMEHCFIQLRELDTKKGRREKNLRFRAVGLAKAAENQLAAKED